MKHYFSRGFVIAIECTIRQFAGGECSAINPHHADERCDGGRIRAPNPQFSWDCPACNGTGRAPGLDLAAVFGRHPITRVVLVDVLVSQEGPYWLFGDPDLGTPETIADVMNQTHLTRTAALDALSVACVAIGRQAAGLPPLPATGEGRQPHPQQVPQGG